MSKNLYPHEIQTAIFSQLLAYETLIKPEFKLRIDRWRNGTIFTYIVKTETGTPSGCQCWEFKPTNIFTLADVDAHLHLFWKDVPKQYKIEQDH